ncbi:MAG: rhomboid family protein [Actinomycetia bacterium]|nr:rhomboid family protein [Actinomycetes bacterium]
MAADQAVPPGAGAPPAPVCYRHTDRETYVSCVRCERPICPDCMNPASVGFQCPACVKQGAATVRTPRTALGGGLSGEGVVTKVLIGLNVAVFVIGVLLGVVSEGPAGGMRVLTGGLPPDFAPFVMYGPSVAGGEWWRLLTAGFLHAGVLHIGLNMWALLLFGTEVERLIGRWRYLAVYVLCCIGGNIGVLLIAPNQLGVGASGAVFGLFGALVFFFRRLNRSPRPLISLIVLNFAIGFFISTISWQAHLGGLITGALTGALLAYAPAGKNRTAYQIAGLVVVAAVLFGGVLLGT